MTLFVRLFICAVCVCGFTGNAVADRAPPRPKPEEKPAEKEAEKMVVCWKQADYQKAIKKGMKFKYKKWSHDDAGLEVVERYDIFEVTEVGEKDFKFTNTRLDKNGNAKGDPTPNTGNFETFFMPDVVKLLGLCKDSKPTEEKVEVGAGKFDCMVYTYEGKDRRDTITYKVYAAKDMPGVIPKMTVSASGTLNITLEEFNAGE